MAITERISRNLHKISGIKRELAVLSDLHWDNPKCDRKQLKKHLDYCLEKEIPVFINGDFFCFMQGRYDPRRSKKDILPEHNVNNYVDAVIEDAVNWFSPYKDILTVLGYGNHCSGLLKNLETDPLQRFVDLFNSVNKSQIYTGGYGGWLVVNIDSDNAHTTLKAIGKYFHGSGGGGIVTKGAINLTRAMEIYENMDFFIMGHIHENSSRNDVRETCIYNAGKRVYEQKLKNIHLAITGTYKEEFGDGFGGWHIERGAPPKPIGGRIITFDVSRNRIENSSSYELLIDSHKFPL